METEELIIEAGHTEGQYWKDVWRYRGLFYFLAWRDILVRYKQTAIGVTWAFLRPLLTVVVFTVLFGHLAKLPANGIPYPILVFAGLLPWQLFANTLMESSYSLVRNSALITKIYFPRLIIPMGAVVTGLVDFLISCAILGALMIWYNFIPDWRIIMLPLFIFYSVLSAIGAGIWLAALNVRFRDIQSVVPFLIQFGLYVSPVGFSSAIIPERWRLVYSLNPMVGVIDGFRWVILRNELSLYWPGFVLSLIMVILLFLTGIWYFRKTERSFADVI
jgi:lipopolysaccharide transport system permease protein